MAVVSKGRNTIYQSIYTKFFGEGEAEGEGDLACATLADKGFGGLCGSFHFGLGGSWDNCPVIECICSLHSELYIVRDIYTFVCCFVHWSIFFGLFCAVNFDIYMRGRNPNTDKAISFSSKPQYTLTASPLRFFFIVVVFHFEP